jgi:hypothetical protein
MMQPCRIRKTSVNGFDELRGTLAKNGIRDIRPSGPGAMSRSIPNEVLRMMLLSDEYRGRLLDLCYEFDSNPALCGLGKDNLAASGLCGD